MSIRINLEYANSSKRNPNRLLEKVESIFGKYKISYNDFVVLLTNNVSGFYVSWPSYDREVDPESKNDRWEVKSLFFRAIVDDELKQKINGLTFALSGDILLRSQESYNEFIVKDVILCEDLDLQDYEKRVNTTIIDVKSENTNYTHSNDILSIDLVSDIPYIVDPESFKKFYKEWREYLEFEHLYSKLNIRYEAIERNPKFYNCYELKDNEKNREDAENYIIVTSDDRKIYVNETCPNLTGSEPKYVICKMEFLSEPQKLGFNNTQWSIVPISEKDILDSIINGTEDNDDALENMKQLVLGDFIKKDVRKAQNTNRKVYEVYFFIPEAIDDNNNFITEDYKARYLKILEGDLLLASTATGDIILYNRGKRALDNLKQGIVKTPILSGLILDPGKYETNKDQYNESNIEFALDKRLNSTQKEAIIKCLNSNGIFTLQGPPGTGKTQTITELVYQFNKIGKKVLISSQTHIAIDNVIERLPKEMNILPIRLVKDTMSMNNKYLPNKLLDNLYDSAYCKFSNVIEDYNKFTTDIQKINKDYDDNRLIYSDIKDSLEKLEKVRKERNDIANELHLVNEDIINLELNKSHHEAMYKFVNMFNENHLSLEAVMNISYEVPKEYRKIIELLANKLGVTIDDDIEINELIWSINSKIGTNRINKLNELKVGANPNSVRIKEIDTQISELEKAKTTMEENGIPSDIVINSINQLLQEKKHLVDDSDNVVTLDGMKFNFTTIDEANPNKTIEDELNYIQKYNDYYAKEVDKLMTQEYIDNLLMSSSEELEKKLRHQKYLGTKYDTKSNDIETIDSLIRNKRIKLESYFNEYFTTRLNDNSLPETEDGKFKKIKAYIDEQENEFKKLKEHFDKYGNIYKDLVNYLDTYPEYVSVHRQKFTKTLFQNNANVYGITCTASTLFRESKNEYLKELAIGDVDINKQDFDVVIIDEVSKATPIEIIIPLLYGKSVVLVGDSRQLPPVFKYHESNFDQFTDEQKHKLLGDHTFEDLKNMVESSLFEEIYNKLRVNRAMLNKQYRFNTSIMNCVNIFYNERLESGFKEEQDNKKKHNLNVTLFDDDKKLTIFNEDKNTYWFNSNKYADERLSIEETIGTKTSFINRLELDLTTKLLELIDEGYGKLKKEDKEKYIASFNAEESDKPTVGVITMYNEQSRQIRRSLSKYKNIRCETSTVDRYQGKERDIIIVNFVRNNTNYNPGEFIKKYNRINVAISRARNMLIIVGSKEFCSQLKINVPDIGSSRKNEIPAYGELFNRCEAKFSYPAKIFNLKKD